MTRRLSPTRRMLLGATAGVMATATLGLSGGCAQNDAQAGAMLGAGVGALGGAIIGHNQGRRTAEGAGIGAGVGAVTGYIIGNEQDKARQRHYYHPNYRY